ncbi:glutamate receptor ionotropic kainate 4, partial [Biomphalaria glabrata]
EPPFIFRNTSEPGSYYGYSMDVLTEIARTVGFTFTVRECDEGGYGMPENGIWNGCIGNIVNGEADVILGALTVTAERDSVIDFTLPYYDFAGIQIITRRQLSNINLFYYIDVFSTQAWLSLISVVLLTSLLLWVYEKASFHCLKSCTKSAGDVKADNLGQTFYLGKSPALAFNNNTFVSKKPMPQERAPGEEHPGARKCLGDNMWFVVGAVTMAVCDSTLVQEDLVLEDLVLEDLVLEDLVQEDLVLEDLVLEDLVLEDLVQEDLVLEDLGLKTKLSRVIVYNVNSVPLFNADFCPGGGDAPRSVAGRVLVAGFWFFAIIIMSTFTANLAAFLTVSRMGAVISSLDDLLDQTDMKYSVVNRSSVMDYFKRMARIETDFYERWKNMTLDKSDSTNQDSLAVWEYPLGNKYGTIWATIQDNGLVNSIEDGLEKVLNENFALITESPLIQYYTGQNCLLTAIGDQFSVRPYAIGLKEKSLYTAKFSEAILKLQKERLLGSIRLKWWSTNGITCNKDTGDTGLDLYSLSGTFFVAGVGVVSGSLWLLIECVLANRFQVGKS